MHNCTCPLNGFDTIFSNLYPPYLTQVAQEELDTMAKLNSRLGYEIKRNELALTNMMKNYDGRKQFAKRLEQVR